MRSRLSRRRSTRWQALLALGATVIGGVSLTDAGVAHAEARQNGPDAPSAVEVTAAGRAAPRRIFSEDFERGMGSTPVLITQYVGLNGVRYRADPEWVSSAQCNGIVTNYIAATAASCGSSEGSVNELAYALGLINGTTPRTNHVVSAWTADRATTPGSVEVGSVQNAPIGSPNRFISFGVDAAAAACAGFAHPSLVFSLVDGGRERPVMSSAIDPCSSPGSRAYTVDGHTVRGGSFVADAALLVSSDSVGWTMRNNQGNYSGNDGAIDGVTMYDATPKLENAFDGSTPVVGDSARLTFTVQNTTENGAKAGWSFADALPEGLTLASDPRAATTCVQADVTAVGGSSTVAVTGGLARGSAACTVTVDVTSDVAGTYSIGADTVTAHTGIDLPGATSITFRVERNELVVEDRAVLGGSDDAVADLGEDVSFAQRVTNTGERRVTGLEVEGTNGPVVCAADALDAGASTDCTTESRRVVQADLDRGRIDDQVTATGRSPLGAEVRATASATQPTAAASPAIGTSLSATLGTDDLPAPGQHVALALTVTNTGNVTLRDVSATMPDRESVSCPQGDLAPKGTITCEVEDHLLTQDDIDNGSISFAETASGTAPDGRTVTAEDDATVALRQAPAVSTSITANLAPSEHEVPSAGDLVEAQVVVTNSGNTTLDDVVSVMRDRPGLVVDCPAGPLAPGASITCAVPDSALTQDDIESGGVEFAETASGTAPGGKTVTAEDSITVGLDARSALFLEGEWTPSDGDPVRPGDTIASAYTVTNTSNLIVRSLSVESEEAGAITCRAEELAPGEETDCAADRPRPVTDDDVSAGRVAFEAVALGAVGRADGSSDRTEPVDVRSNEVRSEFVVVPLPATPAATALPAVLAFTGTELTAVVLVALAVIGVGVVLLVLLRLRRRRA